MKKLRFIIFFFVWLVITVELVFRTADYEQLKTRQPEVNWINDSIMGYLPKPKTSFNLIAPNVNKKIAVNSFGFYDSEMKINRPRGYYRIALVGNSYETGHFSESNKSYLDLCNEIFKSQSQKVECLNFSIDGEYRDWFRIKLIEDKILKFNPDLIILNATMPLKRKVVVKEYYKDIVIDYEQNNKQSEAELKEQIDELSSIKPVTFFYDISFLFRGICMNLMKKNKLVNNSENEFWNRMEIYITRKLTAGNLYKEEFSKSKSADIINDLYNKLNQQGIRLCLLDNSSLDKSVLNENIQYLKIDSYREEKFNSSVYGNNFDKKETNIVALELNDILIKSFIPANFTDNY